jgi:hypothetical protein
MISLVSGTVNPRLAHRTQFDSAFSAKGECTGRTTEESERRIKIFQKIVPKSEK